MTRPKCTSWDHTAPAAEPCGREAMYRVSDCGTAGFACNRCFIRRRHQLTLELAQCQSRLDEYEQAKPAFSIVEDP